MKAHLAKSLCALLNSYSEVFFYAGGSSVSSYSALPFLVRM